MKVALVHDWLIHMRGGEKVLEGMAEVFPDAVIYTLFCNRAKISPSLQRMKIKTSFLQYLPGIRNYYRFLLPFLPFIIKSLRIREADLVFSSSHCVAKGITIPEGAVHLCYCHTPMRYLWGFEKDYFPNVPFFLEPVLSLLKKWLRYFDLSSNRHVHHFIANSENIRSRIKKYYQREAAVIYPPLDTAMYESTGEMKKPSDYYLVVSAFVPYKRIDLVIEAFNTLDRKLLIVGSGPMEKDYLNLRKNSKISFLGAVSNQEIKKLYSEAKALIFPTEEDFGIVPLEAQACGSPVIALGKGGALESVKHGHFFPEQTPEALRRAVLEFETLTFDRSRIVHAVGTFSKDRFKRQIKECAEHPGGLP